MAFLDMTCPECDSKTSIDALIRKTYNIKGEYRCVDCETDRLFNADVESVLSPDLEIRHPNVVRRLMLWVFG